ncbi:alanine dehydrogenase [Terriglobus tenax]|uniref:alanine dehydrogenase n=1 Tax=Terriglobus tenax TaxID=1111115 RepID=UPI0021DF496D|nr:alanine dehydrogenase [Terriglobus tenax]
MLIGVPKEVKNLETRVGITPAGVKELVERGNQLLVEKNAGLLSAFPDEEYLAAGATIVATADEVWQRAEMVVKVKEPVPSEYGHFRPGLVLFTYLHLAPIPELTEKLLESRVTAIAYETVEDSAGALPLLVPMSEVAGRLSVQVGASFLQHGNDGRGLLLGGVPGVPPGEVCILGGGIVGTNAAKIALGMGANVTIVDKNLNRLRQLDDIFGGRLRTLASNSWNIANAAAKSDLLIGGVLIPGASAPKLLTAAMVKGMKKGAVIVDVAIDQGGCIETAVPTTHTAPSYVVDGVVHYCVTNMPAAVPNTSTLALTNATFPYVLNMAEQGALEALKNSSGLRKGLNTHNGVLTCAPVAESQGRSWKPAIECLN